jgi:PAS domain S-box-containing protein
LAINERGAIRSFSLAAEPLFGYQAPDVIGKNCQDADASRIVAG